MPDTTQVSLDIAGATNFRSLGGLARRRRTPHPAARTDARRPADRARRARLERARPRRARHHLRPAQRCRARRAPEPAAARIRGARAQLQVNNDLRADPSLGRLMLDDRARAARAGDDRDLPPLPGLHGQDAHRRGRAAARGRRADAGPLLCRQGPHGLHDRDAAPRPRGARAADPRGLPGLAPLAGRRAPPRIARGAARALHAGRRARGGGGHGDRRARRVSRCGLEAAAAEFGSIDRYLEIAAGLDGARRERLREALLE